METSTSDADLGRILRSKAAECGYSPEAFLDFAEGWAYWQKWSVNWSCSAGPYPHSSELETLGEEHLFGWPDWCEELISVGCQLEKFEWKDGRVVTRLLNPYGRVLAAIIQDPLES